MKNKIIIGFMVLLFLGLSYISLVNKPTKIVIATKPMYAGTLMTVEELNQNFKEVYRYVPKNNNYIHSMKELNEVANRKYLTSTLGNGYETTNLDFKYIGSN